MTNMTLDTDVAEASTSDRDDAVPVVESRKAGPLTWGEDSPGRPGRDRTERSGKTATVPLFLAQETLIQSLQ